MRRHVTEKSLFHRFPVAFALVVAGLFSLRALAGSYFTRTWQVEQGLPQNKVTAVVQTRDGYLWIGTYNGLARFDGVRFMVFDDNNTTALRGSRITSLFDAADGTLWIGTENGSVSQYANGRFTPVPLRLNWSGGKIFDITADEAGDVWLFNDQGELARVRDGKVLFPEPGRVPKVKSLATGASGAIWVDREGVVSLLNREKLTVEVSTNEYVQGICAARGGGLWIACNSQIRKWQDGHWTGNFGVAPWGWTTLTTLFETSAGVLAGGTSDSGLWFFSPGSTNAPVLHLNRTNGLPSDWVISLREDREKNLWCGTGAGLVVVRPSILESVSPPDKWNGRPVLCVLPSPDGAMWVGTEGAGIYRLENGRWTNFSGLANSYVWSLTAGHDGAIWAGTWGGGLLVRKEDGFDIAPGLEGVTPPMPALLSVGNDLWIGTTAGAMRYRNGRAERFTEIAGAPFGDVRAIVQEKSGVLWFGTAGSGLVQLQNGNFRRFRKSDRLSSDFIGCLHIAKDGALWIGTSGGGLNRFKDGRFSIINREQGLPNCVIGHIESDDSGFFWISSYGGLLCASEQDLNRCADGETAAVPFTTYGIEDGMPTLECSEGSQSAGGKTADGRLWFATAKGLVAVDASGSITNPLPPPVALEAVRVDGKRFRFRDGKWRMENGAEHSSLILDSHSLLTIPPGRHRIEFEYTGLSFVAPAKVRFKYRLNNVENDWTDAGTERLAVYNFIPPGRYQFEVIACNNDGVWNNVGATLGFEVLPHFWQTAWFGAVAGLLIVVTASGAVWFETRRRLRRRLERAERQRDIERERSRIAQDIHDDLGAQLTHITMISESARGEKSNSERTAAGLDRICHTARELTRSMDEIVWAVSPRHDTLEGLATYLEKFAHDWLAGVGIRCRLDLPVEFPDWHLSSEVRHNVFLAFKEALHNAVKHSGATEVLIWLTLKTSSFDLAVEDNGRGFDLANAKNISPTLDRVASGNGLENMRRRLAAVGGNCSVESTPGAGTKVIFSVHLKARTSKKVR